MTLGYSYLRTEHNRIDPSGSGVLVIDYSADRALIAMNFNAVHSLGDVLLGGRVGSL